MEINDSQELKEAFDNAMQHQKEQKLEDDNFVILKLPKNAFLSLVSQQFHISSDGSLLVNTNSEAIPREYEWGKMSSIRLAKFVSGVVQLQRCILEQAKKMVVSKEGP